MAVKKTIILEVDAEGGIKQVDELKTGVQETSKAAANSESSFKKMKNGIGAVGLAFKAMGVGLIVSAFAKLAEMLGENQAIMDKVAVASAVFGDVLRRLINPIVEVVKEHIKETKPNLKTRQGNEITTNVVNRTITNLGYDTLPRLSITNNPRAVTLVANLLKSNPNIKSRAIRNELSKIDPKYSNLSAETITKYLNRNHPGERQWKTSEQVREGEKVRHEMVKAIRS